MATRIPSSSPLSSLQSSEATFRTASPESTPRFQSTQLLSHNLEKYLTTYLEESLFQQAFRFLLNLVSAPAGNRKKKVIVPHPEYLSTIATIAVHPRMTTRAESKEQQAQSLLALQLLDTILKTAGPINANLAQAYQFSNFVPSDIESEDWKNVKLNLIYADSQNVFKCRDDFWAVLGWALNCSCLPGIHQERWEYWKRWLEHILDVLESDWELREDVNPRDSLIWQYISTTTGTVAPRRIMRSIFVDGTTLSLNEFDYVFPKELKKQRANQEIKKQEVVVNIDEDIYGDWMQDEESFSEEDDKVIKVEGAERSSKRLRNRTPGAKSRKPHYLGRATEDEESDDTDVDDDARSITLGSPESVVVRLRLLELLIEVASRPELSADFVDLHEMFTLCVEKIKPLPLPIFQRMIMSSKGIHCLSQDSISTLCEFMIQRMIVIEGSFLTTLDPMTPQRLISGYLPHAAALATVEAQAKLSLLIESILRTLLDAIKDQALLQAMSEALNTGIQERQTKAETIKNDSKKKKRSKPAEAEAFKMLSESSMRMTFMLMQVPQEK